MWNSTQSGILILRVCPATRQHASTALVACESYMGGLSSLVFRILGSSSAGYEEFTLLGDNIRQSVVSQQTSLRNMSPPSSGLKGKSNNRPIWSRQQSPAFCSSGTSIDFQRTVLPYIPEKGNLRKLHLPLPLKWNTPFMKPKFNPPPPQVLFFVSCWI
jgi:hypothetical protein